MSTTIMRNKIVYLDITVVDDLENIIESTDGQQAFSYLHGRGNLLAPLEHALENKTAGFETSVFIHAEDSFGNFHQDLVIDVPQQQFTAEVNIEEGEYVQLQGPNGMMAFKIERIYNNHIRLNANHPLADKALTFFVKVLAVRDAHKDEVKHRWSHPAGHHLMVAGAP